jgi:hemolysin-activating ACP:hemolysin acyltransferase
MVPDRSRSLFHVSELNEGSHTWILEIVAPHGHLPNIRKLLHRERFFGDRLVSYSRIVRGRLVNVQLQSIPPIVALN